MGLHTSIQWCDSAVNPVMGCDGCELWMPERGVRICYAGQLHAMRGGRVKGYARDFLTPELFAGRMAAAARWSDLRGTARPDKPWLDGLPRHVFVSDMGDALSASVPFEFLRDEIVHVVAGWPHIGMWLTKQPQRMAEFDEWLSTKGIEWPASLWAGTSITGPGQGGRVRALRKVRAAVRFLSIEPVLRDPGELDLDGIALVILGGESGPGAGPTDLADLRRLVTRAHARGCKVFVKQVGARPLARCFDCDDQEPCPECEGRGEHMGKQALTLRDRKGGDLDELRAALWREDASFLVREWPEVAHAAR